MTEKSSSKSIRIELLGEVQLLLDGAVARGCAAQKRRMALRAYLVRSPERTAHRERLMGLLWPEHAPDAARRLLNESIYVIRRE